MNTVGLPGTVELCLRLAVALLCGAALGAERSFRRKDAGVRTHGIFALAVTVMILAVQLIMHWFSIGNDAYSTSEIRITLVDTPEIRAALRAKQEELGISITNSRITTCGDNTLNLILQVRLKNVIPFKEIIKLMDEHPEIRSLSI